MGGGGGGECTGTCGREDQQTPVHQLLTKGGGGGGERAVCVCVCVWGGGNVQALVEGKINRPLSTSHSSVMGHKHRLFEAHKNH